MLVKRSLWGRHGFVGPIRAIVVSGAGVFFDFVAWEVDVEVITKLTMESFACIGNRGIVFLPEFLAISQIFCAKLLCLGLLDGCLFVIIDVIEDLQDRGIFNFLLFNLELSLRPIAKLRSEIANFLRGFVLVDLHLHLHFRSLFQILMRIVHFFIILTGHLRVLLFPTKIREVPQVPPRQQRRNYDYEQAVDSPAEHVGERSAYNLQAGAN